MKSFVSKLSVLLFGAMFAVGCQDFSEDIREVSENLDKNKTEINASITNLDAALKALEATHAADKAATEKALADLQSALQGKIKADIEAAEAKLTAAYEAADKLLKETAAADKKELEGKVTAAAAAAAAALETAKAQLDAAYKAADQEIKAAYTAADVELKASLQAEINALKEKLEKADSDNKAALEAKIADLDAAYKAADVQVNAAIAAVQANLDNEKTRVDGALSAVNSALTTAVATLEGKIADAENHFKAADELLKTELWAELKLYEKAHVDGDKAVKEALEAQLASVKKVLVDADAADKKALEDKVDALEAALKGDAAAMKAELENTIAEIQASIEALDKKYEGEVARVDAAVAALQSALAQAKTDLEAAYLAADGVLDAAIKANTKLIQDNEAAIAKLTERVDALEEADKVLDAAIKAEAEARKEGDAALDVKVAVLATAIEGEATARTEALAAMAKANALEFARLQGLIEVNVAAIEAQNKALAKANKELSDLIDANKDKIAANEAAIAINTEKLAALEAAYKAADAKIEAAVAANAELIAKNAAALEAFKAQVADKYATKESLRALENKLYEEVDALQADVTRRLNDVNSEVATLKNAFFTEIDAVKAMIAAEAAAREAAVVGTNNAIIALSDAVAADIAALEEHVAEYLAALDANQVTMGAALSDLKALVNANNVELKTALAETQAKLAEDLATAKDELLSAVEAEAAARQASVATINATLSGLAGNIANLGSQVATNSALMETLVADMETIKATYDGFTTGIAELTDRVVDLEANVGELLRRIQSVVYKPTHSDGAARLVYATLGNNLLEGYSYITYKVYPASLVQPIIEKFGKGLELSYDLESVVLVKSGNPSLEVVGVSDRLPEATEPKFGELVLKVKASNLGNDFYYGKSENIYSASLVLTNGNENFSTVYTNLLADNETSSSNEIVMGLYKGATKVENNATESYSWPYIATVGDLHPVETIFNGICAKFEYHGQAYDAKDLEDIYGYQVGYTRAIELSDDYDNLNAIKVSVPENDALTSYVTVCPPALDEFASTKADMANKVTATYKFTDTAGKTLSVSADVTVTDSPYFLKVNDKVTPYTVQYTDQSKIVVSPKEVHVLYHYTANPDNGTVCEQVESEYPALKNTIKYGVSFSDNKDIFNIEGEGYPVTVSLKDVKKENVGEVLEVTYSFENELLEDGPIEVKNTVTVTKVNYEFNLGEADYHWQYTLDASTEANGQRFYTRKTFVNIDKPEQNDVAFKNLDFGTAVHVVTDADGNVVKDMYVKMGYEDGRPYIHVAGFKWDYKYNVQTTFVVEGADVTAKFAFETFNRNKNEEKYTITLPTSQVNYVANITVGIEDSIANIDDWKSILPEVNRGGDDFDFSKYLSEVVSNIIESKVTVNGEPAPANSTQAFVNDGSAIATSFDANDFAKISKDVIYVYSFITAYGQMFEIRKKIEFVMPTYVIGYNKFYYTVDGNYATAWGKFLPEDHKIPVTGFEVNNIQMLDVFDKLYAAGTTQNLITKDPATDKNVLDKNLKIVYTPVDEKFGQYMVDNVLAYEVDDNQIFVDAKLYLVNDNKSEIEVETNWSVDYIDFYVKKYSPINPVIEVADAEVVLNYRGKYSVNLLELLTLKDIKDRVIISGGLIDDTNYAGYLNRQNFYGLDLAYDLNNVKVDSDIANKVTFTPKKGDKKYLNDVIVTFDYSSDLTLNSGFEIEVPVTYTHNWGLTPETGAATGTVVIKFVLP